MEKLNEKEWKPIPMKRLFTKFVRGKVSSASDEPKRENGVPYVGATDRNNGVIDYLEADKAKIQPGNCVTFIRDGQGSVGSSVYRATPCIATVNTSSGYAKWLNQDTGLFVSTSSNQVREKYSFGYKRKETRLLAERVMLPVTDSGEPDYVYMAEYAQQMRDTMLAKYRAYVEERIAELGEAVEIPALVEKEWKEFRIGELFEVSRPKARNKDDYDLGDIPFVASGAMNNGVMKCCKTREGEQLDAGNCITVSPVDGSSFYQPMDFLGRGGAGSSILMLRNDGLNLLRGEFMVRMIQQTCSKYSYGHMGNKDSIKRERVMLPVTDSGEPDYAYMEQYAKNMMIRKYKQYLTFADRAENKKQ